MAIDYVRDLKDRLNPYRWKVIKVNPDDESQMAVGDRLKFEGIGGGTSADILKRKHLGTFLVDWADSCDHIITPTEKVTMVNQNLGPYHIIYTAGTKAQITCWPGGGPSGAVWTAEDQG